MDYGGAYERVRLKLVLSFFDRGLSLTLLRLKSLHLRPGFDTFCSELGRFLEGSTLPTTGDQDINAALEVLRTERKGNSTSAMAHGKNRADQPDQPRAPEDKMDSALKILVRNATDEFGFIPRDVYRGVLRLPQTKEDHDDAVKALKYPSLVDFVENFPENRQISDSLYDVVAVRPIRSLESRDAWMIDFKSTRIKWKVMEKMQLVENNRIRETFGSLRNAGENCSLARWFFELFAHCVLSGGWKGPAPQLTRMRCSKGEPHVFHIDSSSQLSFLEPYTRTIKEIKLTKELSDVTLDEDKYYKPAAANNSPFDSFTINRGLDGVTVEISIFQMTVSKKHRGSPEGNLFIRDLITRVRELLNDNAAEPEVNYILVCPNDTLGCQWNMPDGWIESCTQRDPHGKVFCIRIPILLFPGTALPKFAS